MPRPPRDTPLSLRTRDGVDLVGTFVIPAPTRGTLVACHPHPLYGGTMTNKVVHSLYKAFRDTGFAALRFNFRGAGGSGGVHGHGSEEVLDVQAAAAELDRLVPPTRGAPRVVGGFSFGSVIGMGAAAHDPDVTHRVAIGLPLGLGEVDGRTYDWSFFETDHRPLFLLVGEEDEYCPQEEFEARVSELRAAAVPVHAVVIPGANHFFDGLGHVLRQELFRVAAQIVGDEPEPRRHPVREVA